MMVEVRCCCDPDLLIGWINAPIATLRPGQVVSFPLKVESPTPRRYSDPPEYCATFEACDLEVGQITRADGETRLAFNSKEMPLDQLRRVVGFRSAL